MANRAVGRKSCCGVARVGCALVIGLMTNDARRASQIVVVIDVAGSAWHGHVCASQRKSGGVVVKVGFKPCIYSVAGLAICRETVGNVIWSNCALEIPHVAGIALRR